MSNSELLSLLKDPEQLIPAIVQDSTTREVLMLAYMNLESLTMTLASGQATYWSRSRNELWVKGATSGHFQQVNSISLDCDGDALLVTVTQTGVACHTGEATCFHKPLQLSAQ
jgi:phosphoribosyl-AMP cyclohydrolase